MFERRALSSAALVVAAVIVCNSVRAQRSVDDAASRALAQLDPSTIIDSPMPPDQRKPVQPNLTPSATIIVIGDEKVPVRLRLPDRHRSAVAGIDDGTSAGFFEPLADAARAGNDDAAGALYEALDLCKHSMTRSELDAAEERGRKWFAQTGGVAAPGEPPLDLERWVENLEASFHRCAGVTDDMYQTATELVRESVERGFDGSRVFYARALASTDPAAARAQYAILWEQGYLSGLNGLSTDSLPHRIAFLSVETSLFHSPRSRDELNALEASISSSEFREASREAAKLLDNPSCCKL